MANTNPVAASATSTAEYDAIIIGSGFGGLYALHHLRDEMGLSVRAFDGAGDVGGTWWYNRYPGARVDAPSSPFYAYTFSKELVDEWEWAETQTERPDVLAYLEHFADRFDLRRTSSSRPGSQTHATTKRRSAGRSRPTRASAHRRGS